MNIKTAEGHLRMLGFKHANADNIDGNLIYARNEQRIMYLGKYSEWVASPITIDKPRMTKLASILNDV